MIKTVSIIGAGLAGITAAQTLRSEGFDGKIFLFGDEPCPPYDRPSLSKEVLAGEFDTPPALVEESWIDDAGIELISGESVSSLDVRSCQIELQNGATLGADAVLLATGSYARRLKVKGSELAGIYTLRTLSDCMRLKDEFRPGRSLVVVGGGLIGCEVATTARMAGLEVTIIEAGSELMQRVLDPITAGWCRQAIESLGVHVRLNANVRQFLGSQQVRTVSCGDGEAIAADFVLVSIGAEPATGLGEAAGIACDRGYIVDAAGRTNCENIYAAGDVACWPVLGGGRRSFETYLNSQAQAAVAAKAMIGNVIPSPQTPMSWTKIAGHHLQMAGDMVGPGEQVIRGVLSSNSFAVFRIFRNRVIACVTANVPRDFAIARRLIDKQASIDAISLTNTDVSLRDLLGASQRAGK